LEAQSLALVVPRPVMRSRVLLMTPTLAALRTRLAVARGIRRARVVAAIVPAAPTAPRARGRPGIPGVNAL
jgi:hypothetical protein